MAIQQYLHEIARGKVGARNLNRQDACDFFGKILDGQVDDLEIGAFCIAMRFKGETVDELLGFLDAIYRRIYRVHSLDQSCVVIPSYNGARKLPVLTPLLAMLLAKRGLPVLVHGCVTELGRVHSQSVFQELGVKATEIVDKVRPGEVCFIPTRFLHPKLQYLLETRFKLGVRNTTHSLVKLLQPCLGKSLLVTSYTHKEYETSMREVLQALGGHAMLLRGTEGESVADLRRTPKIQGVIHGKCLELEPQQKGSLTQLPPPLGDISAKATADYVRQFLNETLPVPRSIETQIRHISYLMDLT